MVFLKDSLTIFQFNERSFGTLVFKTTIQCIQSLIPLYSQATISETESEKGGYIIGSVRIRAQLL